MRHDSNDPSYPKGRAPIRPELLAAKLAAIRNFEYPALLDQVEVNPRLVETLWFLQAMSLRPGGLLKFAEELLAEFPERLGTPTMLKAKAKTYGLEQKIAILQEMPEHSRPGFAMVRDGTLAEILSDSTPEEVAEMDGRDRSALKAGLKDMDAESFRDVCRQEALEQLPEYFTALCTEKSAGVRQLWFFHDVVGSLLEFMDRSAAKVQQRLAMTEVAKLIFDRLDYALAERVMVRIEGGSRIGKTEALSAWADMRPGLARLVRVPCDNSMVSFFKRIGEALGIDFSHGSNPSRLKERVEYVIQHGGLFLVLDEGHFMVPASPTATTPPHRLNWVRTEIVDRGLPLAISVTPQAFKGAIDRFLKKTRYDMAQFFGRDFLPCVLPEVLSEADLTAAARKHFPQLGENALGYIANEARLSENYLQGVEAIARRTRHLARKRGGEVKLTDIKTAVSEVLRLNPASTDQRADLAAGDSLEANRKVTRRAGFGNGAATRKPLPATAPPGSRRGAAEPARAAISDGYSPRGMTPSEELIPVEA
ncbi:MAG TPA: hypothetical protein P5205_17700 [Candidatus Paceibacterota bacterium]|nr:hypothetical protein [Verrucomicrobiota bacterium]HSA12199.1 hypothetical protein [Candidatus Paceibacterota bacterium]